MTSIVVTSLVWVCIIYQTRKKSEECSVTNTDETIVPPDVPSYLSSQGTLSERQDVCIRVDAGGAPQPNGHIDTTAFDGTVVCPDCMENGKSYSRDPDYPGHGLGPAASEYQRLPVTRHHPHPHPHPRQEGHREALCNGSPNGSPDGIRRDVRGTTLPRNHNTSQHNHSDREGSLSGRTDVPAGDESFHHHHHHPPHRPLAKPAEDTDCDSEARRALLPNGHALRASQIESAPLRRASD